MIDPVVRIGLQPHLFLTLDNMNRVGIEVEKEYNDDLQFSDDRNHLAVLAWDQEILPTFKRWTLVLDLDQEQFSTLHQIIDTFYHYQRTGVKRYMIFYDGVSDFFPTSQGRAGTQLSVSTHAGIEVEEKQTIYMVFPLIVGPWFRRIGGELDCTTARWEATLDLIEIDYMSVIP